MEFQGIKPEAFWLLAENRFQDSHSFYEAHREQIRREVVEPLKALARDLTETVLDIDPRIVVDPNRNGTVSRVRRDNRYTRDKSMYRENMWVAFLRDKKVWECVPGFYADFSLRGCSYGMGFYSVRPSLMNRLRQMMDEQPKRFLTALQQASDAGFQVSGERYALPKRAGLPPLLEEVANRKCFSFDREELDPAFYGSEALVPRLIDSFRVLTPIYHLLLEAVEAEQLQNV